MSLPSLEPTLLVDPATLVKVSKDLVGSLVLFAESAGIDTTDIQRLLYSLSESLRHIGALLPDLGSAASRDSSSDSRTVKAVEAIEAFHRDLDTLWEFVKTSNEPSDSTSSFAGDHGELTRLRNGYNNEE
jgi:hypothetical protein